MRQSRKIIISGAIGNALENYDYVLYANFAVTIGKLFFPLNNLYDSLLATFGVFAAGFLMRPIGAIIFGHIGDKYSRKLALSASIMLMSIPTALIGILPSYLEIGIWAPLLLIFIRLLQGLSIGGETSGFMTYLMESMPHSNKKGLIGSIAVSSTALGLFLGFVAAFICNFYFSSSEWAWRVPFLLSLPVGMIGIYIRSKLEESPEFKKLKDQKLTSKFPLRDLFQNYKKRFFVICGLYVSVSVQFYFFFAFLSTFLVKILNYSQLQISIIYLCCTILFGCLAPLAGWFSDRFGIYKILLLSIISLMIFIFPIFALLLSSNFILAFIGCIFFIIIMSFYQGSLPSIILKIFPTKVRAIGTAFSFNIISAIFAGLTPLALTFLMKVSGSYYAAPSYILLTSSITVITLLLGKTKNLF